MKTTHHIMAGMLGAALAAHAAGDLPRNPFWPQNHEGTRYPITLTPRFPSEKADAGDETTNAESDAAATGKDKADRGKKTETPSLSPEAQARLQEEQLWSAARAALRFDGLMNFGTAQSVKKTISINGKVYVPGDLVSVNLGDRRFTWKVKAIGADNKIQLLRMKSRAIQLP